MRLGRRLFEFSVCTSGVQFLVLFILIRNSQLVITAGCGHHVSGLRSDTLMTVDFCAAHACLDLISHTELHYIKFAHYIRIIIVVYVFLLFVHVFLLLSMYTYCWLRILRRGYPD